LKIQFSAFFAFLDSGLQICARRRREMASSSSDPLLQLAMARCRSIDLPSDSTLQSRMDVFRAIAANRWCLSLSVETDAVADEGLAILMTSPTIRSLAMPWEEPEQHITSKGLMYIVANTHLTDVALDFNMMSTLSYDVLAALFASPSIAFLTLWVPTALVHAFGNGSFHISPNLTYLDIISEVISPSALVPFLSSCSHLRFFRFRLPPLREDQANAAITLLSSAPHLHTLALQTSDPDECDVFSESRVQHFAQHASSLTSLSLSAQRINVRPLAQLHHLESLRSTSFLFLFVC
jgi:hypothetical protein